jgi:hypothetical protein
MELRLEDIHSLEKMDQHYKLLIPFVKKILEQNRKNLVLTHPNYRQIRRGAKQLWINYFRYADEDDETIEALEPLSSIILRLCQDLVGQPDIKAYATMYGIPLLDKRVAGIK